MAFLFVLIGRVSSRDAGGLQLYDLPHWLQDNEFIREGYRPSLTSLGECIRSVFTIHTETGNIWTHLLSSGLFLYLGLDCFSTACVPNLNVGLEEKSVLGTYFAGCIICFALSSVYHTFNCRSEHVLNFCCKMDYMGINCIILGSICAWIYYGYQCEETLKNTYYVVTFSLGVMSICVSSLEKFNHVNCRPLRACVFAMFAGSSAIPIGHYIFVNGLYHAVSYASVGWVALQLSMYLLGGILYTCRIPERWCPGKFDVYFQSHQLFHMCITIGALFHYHGIMNMFNYRRIHNTCMKYPIEFDE